MTGLVPLGERLDGGRQGREDPVAADAIDEPGTVELDEEILFDPCHREHDVTLFEVAVQLVERVDGGDVDRRRWLRR